MKSFILFIFIGCLCHAVFGQPLPSFPSSQAVAVTQLPTIDYGPECGYVIQQWTVNGRLHAQRINTNWSAHEVISQQSPKNGGTTTNVVRSFTLTTNAEVVLRDSKGVVFGFTDALPAPQIRRAFVVDGLQTSTNLLIWCPAGWWCDSEPSRFFKTTGPLTLRLVTFTN